MNKLEIIKFINESPLSIGLMRDNLEVVINDFINSEDESLFRTTFIEKALEYDAQAYARNRASAYDSIGNQLDMMMKDKRDGTTTHQTACEAVKAKYPKPE
jgi:hypothetical protein